MTTEQGTFDDSEVLRTAARMLESLAIELRDAAQGNDALLSYKSALTLNLVASTLREWADQLANDGFIQSLARNEAILRMVRPGA